MIFYKLDEIPIGGDEKVFKASPMSQSIPVLLFLGLGIAGITIGICGGIHGSGRFNGLSAGNAYWAGGFLVLFGLIFLGIFRASLKTTNWLLRCTTTGIIIKYRSYLNWRLPPEDIQAVGFDYSEIAWVRKVRGKRTSPDTSPDGGSIIEYSTYLDFCLTSADTSELKKHLEAERQRKSNTLYLDYPVEVLDGEIVRVHWRGIVDYFSPNAGKAVKYLSRFVQIVAKDSTKVDLTHQSESSPGEEDAKILKLVRNGDKISAITLTLRIYGCSLTEATQFVEKLQSDKKGNSSDL